jgi:acetyl-CoA carboxylase biotin carboxyl carrier protein
LTLTELEGTIPTAKGANTLPESFSQDELEEIRQLLQIVSDNELTELNVTQANGFGVTVRTVVDTPLVAAPLYHESLGAYRAPDAAPEPAAAPTGAGGHSLDAVAIESPMVGTYYRAPSPADPPFVREGDIIRIGQPIGLIEAMKVYSEIPAEHSGRVVEIVATNGHLVQLGEPLMYVEPA